ncbi:hypothetical protein FOZ63_025887, partial [Perkinsus olseni]
ANLKILQDYNISVQHGVDAVRLPEEMKGELFDVIIWNHPHLGVEDAKLHQVLMAHFADSARRVLRSDGRVLLCLVDGQAKRWNLANLASLNGLHLIGKPRPFPVELFPSFRMVRNRTYRTFKNHQTQKQWVPAGNDAEVESMFSTLYVLAKNRCSGKAERCDSADGNSGESPMKRARKKAGDYVCEICDKRFTTNQGLFTHNRQVHELGLYHNRAGVKCSACGVECRDEEGLAQHRAAKHSGVHLGRKVESAALRGTGEVCKICGYRLMEGESNGGNIDGHLGMLRPVDEEEFKCEECGKEFVDGRALGQHQLFCGDRKGRDRGVMYGEPVPLNFTRKRRYPGDQPELMGVDTRYSPPMPPPLMPPPLTGMEVDPGPPTRGPDGYSWENLVFETIDPAVPSLAVNLPVPLDRAGLVVGVRGNTVRSLESQCGVEISVAVRDDDPLRDPSTNTTHVHVRGPKYGVYEAMQRIGDLFRYRHPLPEMHTPPPPVVPSELLPPPLPVMNHHSAYEANPESLSAVDKPNLVSFDILDDHCGLVIGRRGRMLADLREESGASIELVSGDDPTQPKKCLVWSSDPDKVDDALVRLARVLSRLPDALPVPPPKNPEAEERALNPRWVEEDYRGGPPPPSVPVAGLPRVDVSAATAAAVAVSHFDSPEAVDACAPNRDTPLDAPVEYYVDVPADKAELLTDRTMQDLRRRSQCFVELMPIDDEQESSEDAPLMWRRLMLYGMPVPIHYAIVKLKDIMKGEVVEVGDSANTKVKEYPKIGEGDEMTRRHPYNSQFYFLPVDSGTPSTQYSRMQDEADAEKGEYDDEWRSYYAELHVSNPPSRYAKPSP